MKRFPLRILGIFMGLFVGTALALVSFSVRRSMAIRQANQEAQETRANTDPMESSDEEPGDLQTSQAAPPDPGRRHQLQELNAASASEPNWTRRFELTERSGETIRSEDLKGQPYVVCFFFTTCPRTCKRQSGEMRLLQSKFKGKPIRFVSISVDPDVDTPEVLREYAESFGADPKQWLFLTGPLEDVIRIGTEMFYLPGVERRGHPDRFCLVNAEGTLVGSYIWLDSEEREQLITHIDELLSQ